MRRGIGCAFVLVVTLATAGVASASTLCVPNNAIPACHGTGADEPSITDAVNNAQPTGDTIFIGAGTYNESVDDSGKAITFVGAGVGKTIIQGLGSPAFNVQASGSTLTGLTIRLYNAPGETGLQLAGTALNVAVTGAGTMNATNSIGVALVHGSFSRGTVSLPLTGGDVTNYGGVIGPGNLNDSTVTAAVGIADAGGISPGIPTVHRVHILANQGVLVETQPFTMDGSVIRTVPGSSPELGIGFDQLTMFGSFSLRHVDLIGSSSPGSTGASAVAYGLVEPATTTALLESSIVRGYATSVSALANNTGLGPTSTTITVSHTFYDSARATTVAIAGGHAVINRDSRSANLDPLFVNPATGDFRLKAGSTAIDGGESALAAGESITDLDGHARAIAGHNGDAPTSDIGAYEFQPHAPTITASANTTRIASRRRITFSAIGADASPGDAVTFRWRFDDGGVATGASVSHAFVRQGRHTATVTATDLDGFTAGASVTVTILGPAISKLRIKRARHRITITYHDSQAGTTTLKLFRRRSRRALKTLTHHDRAGGDSIHLTLSPGRYRLTLLPHNPAGTGARVTARFKV